MTKYIKAGQFRVPEGYGAIVGHASESREFPYGGLFIRLAKLWMRASGTTVTVVGSENIPADGGALLASNHTNYLDMVWVGVPAHLRGRRLVRFMAKKEIFEHRVAGVLMRSMKHLSVDRAAGTASVSEAVARLKAGDLVAVFPEATVSQSYEIKELKSGAVRIAAEAGVPLIPVATWGGQRILPKGGKAQLGRKKIPVRVHVGTPIDPAGDPVERTAALKVALQELLGEARGEYEREYGPFPGGESWRPASLGGGAPTLEEAREIEKKEKEERARR